MYLQIKNRKHGANQQTPTSWGYLTIFTEIWQVQVQAPNVYTNMRLTSIGEASNVITGSIVFPLSYVPVEISTRGALEGYGFLAIPVGWLFHPHN